MEKDEIIKLLDEAEKCLARENRLIKIESGRVVFVGDTHGDVEATEKVITKYLSSDTRVVFLGDYIDRGQSSKENINLLLRKKVEYPENLILLMGNHEGRPMMNFYPANFWEELDPKLYDRYADVLTKLPLAVSTSNGIIALHGALPGVENLEYISEIALGSEEWRQITWGDWGEGEGEYLRGGAFVSRPQFGLDWFDTNMQKFRKNVLIRSHQPNVSQVIYSGRCLTIFTSAVYRAVVPNRTIAIADLSKEVKTVDDLVLETI